MKIRPIEEKDYEDYKNLFEEAFSEYLKFLKHENPDQYMKEKKEKRAITHSRFDFYLKTGSIFVAEQDENIVGYVASQTLPFMHGVDRLLWIEYIVVQKKFRRKRIGLALLRRLMDHAQSLGIKRIYTTINPDNKASIKLHHKAGFNIEDWKVASAKITSP